MGKHTSVLDGPRMGYGPGPQQPRGGMPLSTVILAVLCVVLATLLALSLAGRHQAAERAAASPSSSPYPSGTHSPPAGAPDAVAAFVGAWSLAPAERDNVLASVTATGVVDTVTPATAAALATTQPAGAAAYTQINALTLSADQPLTDGATLRLQLLFDQSAVYGWLVSSVQRD